MYKGFNLDLRNSDLSRFASAGRAIHDQNKFLIRQKLDSFKDENGNLLASEIIAKWFPPIDANVFLSHSHKDEEQIIALAGWLHEKFGLNPFIDSCIWGYSGDLLRMIDDEYCYNKLSDTYNYQKRNRSTSHVYMMLSTALAKMINHCECIMFVNTPNSISPKDYINSWTTDSPWIYSEIAMTSIIQKRTPAEHRSSTSLEHLQETMSVRYDVDLTHLIPLTWDDLYKWQSSGLTSMAALNELYTLKG